VGQGGSDFQDTTTELGGFFVQEEDAGADPMTLEGVFVCGNGGGVDVTEGDVVRVRAVSSSTTA